MSQVSNATLRLDSQVSPITLRGDESVTESVTVVPEVAEIPAPGTRTRRNTPMITVEDHDSPGDAPAPAPAPAPAIFHEAGYEGSNMVANPMYGSSGSDPAV